jgi:hypothetical protein
VRLEDAVKLKAKAKEGHCVRFSTESKGHHIYWPDKRTVTVECNLILENDQACILIPVIQPVGEKERNSSLDQPKLPSDIPLPSSPPSKPTTPSQDPLEGFERPPEAKRVARRGACLKKPSKYVCRVTEGSGVSDGCSKAPAYPT